MIAHPDCVMGLGDGGAHVGIISDASYPTYLLSPLGPRPQDMAASIFPIWSSARPRTPPAPWGFWIAACSRPA